MEKVLATRPFTTESMLIPAASLTSGDEGSIFFAIGLSTIIKKETTHSEATELHYSSGGEGTNFSVAVNVLPVHFPEGVRAMAFPWVTSAGRPGAYGNSEVCLLSLLKISFSLAILGIKRLQSPRFPPTVR